MKNTVVQLIAAVINLTKALSLYMGIQKAKASRNE